MPLPPRRFRRATRAGLLALALAFAGSACRPRPEVVHLDLQRTVLAADAQFPWDVIVFGTPAAESNEDEGFTRDPLDGRPSAVVSARAPISVWWPAPAPRAMIVELQPEGDAPAAACLIRLNGTRVGEVQLSGLRQRLRVELPAEAQKARRNRIRLEFSPRVKGTSARVRLFTMVLGAADDPRLSALQAVDAPPPLGTIAERDARGLVQVSGSSVRFSVRLPRHAELRFRPRLHPRERASALRLTFRATLETETSAEHEIGRWTVGAEGQAAGAEVRVPITGRVGSFARIGLGVEGGDGKTPAWGVWVAPRLLGEPPSAEPRLVRASTRPPSPALAALRQALRGTSTILVILDAAGARHFGCYGYGRKTTPEIDRIASESIVFEQAVTTAPLTRTAMASIWTSRYPDQSLDGVPTRQAPPLPQERLRLAQILSAQGVHTAAFIANTNADPGLGLDAGFSEYHRVYRESGLAPAEVLRPAVSSWLKTRDHAPFFAYVHFKEPHFPYNPPAPFDSLFVPVGAAPMSAERLFDVARTASDEVEKPRPSLAELGRVVALYDGTLAYGDHEVGLLRKTLEEAGLWDRITLIITADHGEALLEHEYVGHSYQVYEESIHVPLIVHLPRAAAERARRIGALVDHVDLAPTIADLFGLADHPDVRRHFMGQSLMEVIAGEPSRTASIARSAGNQPRRALRDGRVKALVLSGTRSTEVYDLTSDPAERANLGRENPLRAAFYRQALARWLLSVEERPADARAGPLTPEETENLKAMGYLE